MIDGVIIRSLKRIPDERGTIMHGMSSDNMLSPFGEVYFKKLYKGVINGWHIHTRLQLNLICISGMVKLVLYDTRDDSKTKGEIEELFIGEDNYCLVHVPAGVANGTKGMTDPYALLCNIASESHNPNVRYKRINPNSGEIPYDWRRKDY